jgi:hypothetical protein
VCTRYRKAVGEWKDIESDFYADGSLNHREPVLERLLEMLLDLCVCLAFCKSKFKSSKLKSTYHI